MHARTHKRFLISLFFLSKISFSAVLIGLIDHLKQIRLDYMGEDVGRGVHWQDWLTLEVFSCFCFPFPSTY